MKRYRIIIIGAITLLIAIFIGFTVRINMIFPNAKDVTYTSFYRSSQKAEQIHK
jgi:hypothetical protein